MKPVVFLGDSLERLRAFPQSARRNSGYQLDRVQRGLNPDDWKPMTTVGPGVREIRVRDASGAFRILFCTLLPRRLDRHPTAIWRLRNRDFEN
jgi:phage-related protein